MGIVRFALRFPHTFYVLAGLMLFLGCSAILVTPKDIFPPINIPVVTVIWQYTGLTPEEMEQRVTTYSEYAISASVSNIRNMESQSLSGLRSRRSFSSRTSISTLRSPRSSRPPTLSAPLMPTGIQSPIIVQYNASSVPVLQLSLSSDSLNEQQLYDYGIYQYASNWRRFPASLCRRRTAASIARSWSISIRTRCAPAASPRTTW